MSSCKTLLIKTFVNFFTFLSRKKEFPDLLRNLKLLLFVWNCEDANVIIDKASSEANFVWMERETRCLADPRSHESIPAFKAGDCVDVRSVEAVNCYALTGTGMREHMREFEH
jgi:hypothetical protein